MIGKTPTLGSRGRRALGRRKKMVPGWPATAPDAEPNIVSENRYGKFQILHAHLDTADPSVIAFMSKVLITKAEAHYQSKSIRYEGYSNFFNRLNESYMPPDYTIKVTVDIVPEHIPQKQHSKWIEEKCISINELQENNIFYARSAIKNYYYMNSPARNNLIESQYVYFSVEKMPQPEAGVVTSGAGMSFLQAGGIYSVNSNTALTQKLDEEIDAILNISPTVADIDAIVGTDPLTPRKGK